MKTNISSISKRKFFLFFTTFLFLSVFFVGADGNKTVAMAAMDCYDLCADEVDMQTCFDDCAYGNNGITGWDDSGAATDFYDASSEGALSNYCDTVEGQNDPQCNAQYDYYIEGGKKGDSCKGADNWYSFNDSCANGYTCGANGFCEVSTYGSLTGVESQQSTPSTVTSQQRNAATSNATAATSVQNAAAQRVNTEMAQQDMICKTSTKVDCEEATKSLNEAKAAYDKATSDAQVAIAEVNALSGNSSSGAGYMFCANGIYATVCEGNVGTPYTVGIGGYSTAGGYSGGSGLPGSYSSGGVSSPKCGANFQDIGGVCFPTNTGLSNAPIHVIISNLFSWLMGLFTTLAVLAFVISGVQYLLVAADEDMVKTAKSNAKNALIGIIVGLSGFIIIKAIAAALSGQSIFF